MGLKSLLDNPNGGQVLSASIALAFSVGLVGFVGVGVVLRLLRGEPVELNRDGVVLVLLSVTIIPALIKFIRSRHAR